MKRVAIVQSCYIPWKGYFDMIGLVDEFILFDEAQYTRRDWRNRNRVKTPRGTRWLTIPVETKGRFTQRIDETRVEDPDWPRKHWNVLSQSYARAPHFKKLEPWLEELYLGCRERLLSRVNFRFLSALCGRLGLKTKLSWSTDYRVGEGRTAKLVDLCRQAGASEYLSGPAAKAYLEEERFREAGISVRWMDYSDYPEYPQLHPPFIHEVSILDLLLSVGDEAPRYLKCFRQEVKR